MSDHSSEVKRGQFVWWTGIVEVKDDPLKLGRCKVRIFGWHPDEKEQMPTFNLPWSQVMLPTNNTEVYAPKNGDFVVGFFMDGEVGQQPIIMGVVPGIPLSAGNQDYAYSDSRTEDELSSSPRPPMMKEYLTDGTGITIIESGTADLYPLNIDEPTTSRLARNDDDTITETFIQERKDNVVTGVETAAGETWDEPETMYNAVYPWNNAMESESGHILEFDDTYEAERIHLAHRNGSFVEWFPDGDQVEKVTKDRYTIIMGSDRIYVMGDVNITVQGNAGIYVKLDATVKVDGNVDATVGGNVTADVTGDVSATVGGNMTADIAGDCTETVGGNKSIDASGSCDISAGGAISISGASVSISGQPINLN